jgi:hypothetical protein
MSYPNEGTKNLLIACGFADNIFTDEFDVEVVMSWDGHF